ncbi:hypothetical protein [Campylobacter troglodytis]|uniref:hypothetical protein n=1 Tax=Campylobacter troglodytis TaxID=654363 RepID=UPI00115B1CD7|nr:hypothetical protein [Campylobacter troglodytis]
MLIILLNCIVLWLETTHFVKDTSHFEPTKWLKIAISHNACFGDFADMNYLFYLHSSAHAHHK